MAPVSGMRFHSALHQGPPGTCALLQLSSSHACSVGVASKESFEFSKEYVATVYMLDRTDGEGRCVKEFGKFAGAAVPESLDVVQR